MSAASGADKLVIDFAKAKMAHINAIYEDSARAEQASSKYIEIAEQLIALGEPGILSFAQLLSHERREVRTAAATFLLPYRTEQALMVLKGSSRGRDITALAARMTLARWEGGERKVWQEIERISENAPLPKRRKRLGPS